MSFLLSMFNYLFSFLLLYKYWGLFLVAFLSSVVLPLPASAALSAAGGFASQGYLNIYAVMIVTTMGSVMGDMLDYFLASIYGEKVLQRSIFFKHLMRSKSYKKVQNYIVDFAPSLVFFSRFMAGISPATNILAGLTEEISAWYFLILIIVGETAYTLIYALTGFFLGNAWQNNIYFIAKFGAVVLSIGILLNLIQIWLYRRRKI